MTKEKEFNGFSPRPNLTGFTSIPNEFFTLLPNISSMSELKVLLAVFRKTYGWIQGADENGQPIYKLADEISYTQFEEMTGLSSTSVSNGLDRAIKDGFLMKVQQGDYSGVTSAYKIVTTEDYNRIPKKAPAPTPKQNPPAPTGGFVPQPLGTGNTKQDMLQDIFGTSPEPVEEKPKKESPHHKFIQGWYRRYYSMFNTKYAQFTGKEHGHVKMLLKDYNLDTLEKAMDFYFTNYQNIDGVPAEYPVMNIFFGFRHKIIANAVNGVLQKKPNQKNTREFNQDKWDGGFFDN